MLNVFIFIQVVIGFLLISVILLQKTSVDGVSSLSGNNMGLIGFAAANKFLLRTTVFLAIFFIANSLILANISSTKGTKDIAEDIQIQKETDSSKTKNIENDATRKDNDKRDSVLQKDDVSVNKKKSTK